MPSWAVVGALAALRLCESLAFGQEAAVEPSETPGRYQLRTADDAKVHIDTSFASAGLEPAELGAGRCLAPCDRLFSRDGVYRITGAGLIPSKAFQLPARSNQVTLDVDAGLTAQKTAGAVMGVGGIVVTSLGLLYSVVVAVENVDGPPASGTQRSIAIGTTVGGLAATAIGALLYFTAGTSVRAKGAPLRFAF